MSDAVWGFWGSVVGSLVGGFIAWVVAKSTTKVQLDAANLQEVRKHAKEMTWRLICEINEYILWSFNKESPDAHMQRHRAARAMLTTALLAAPSKVTAIKEQVIAVSNYHKSKNNLKVPSVTGVHFTGVNKFFVDLQNELCQEQFGVAPLQESSQ